MVRLIPVSRVIARRETPSGGGARQKSRSVDHAWTIHADKADVITVFPMHAGHVGKAVPARAPVSSHLPVDVRLQIRLVDNNASGIVAGETSTGSEKDGTGNCQASRRGYQQSERNNDPQIPTHC